MSSFDSSLVLTQEREIVFSPVLSAMLESCLQICQLSAITLNTTQYAVFMTNCLHFIQTALLLYPFTSTRAQLLDQGIHDHLKNLISEQVIFFFLFLFLVFQIYKNNKKKKLMK